MARCLTSFSPVAGDPQVILDAFVAAPERWLPAARRTGPGRWRVTLTWRGLSRPVRMHVGTAWTRGATTWRALSWQPLSGEGDPLPLERLLPQFAGELGVHHPPGGDATVMLDGAYDPPAGAVGELADSIVLHRVARRTVQALLGDIAANLAVSRAPAPPIPAASPPMPTGPDAGAHRGDGPAPRGS